MSYMVTLRDSAEKELESLPVAVHDRIVNKLLSLEVDARPHDCKKLKGREAYRVRVGQYRVLYKINEKAKEVIIESVGHRKDIYK